MTCGHNPEVIILLWRLSFKLLFLSINARLNFILFKKFQSLLIFTEKELERNWQMYVFLDRWNVTLSCESACKYKLLHSDWFNTAPYRACWLSNSWCTMLILAVFMVAQWRNYCHIFRGGTRGCTTFSRGACQYMHIAGSYYFLNSEWGGTWGGTRGGGGGGWHRPVVACFYRPFMHPYVIMFHPMKSS